MTALRSARDRARLEVTAEILAMARTHLATDGAAALSLRAVARDLGLVSSAVYRYFENRDALLTALIVDSYNSLGEAAESAAAGTTRSPHRRWIDTAHAIRSWALERPQEYALLYGSPVPGYVAPADTVAPGTRVSLALVGIVRDAARDGMLERAVDRAGSPKIPGALERELAALSALIGPELDAPTVLATLLAWTQLFGLLSFEVFGQTRGITEDHRLLFDAAAEETAHRIGLVTTRGRGRRASS